MSNIRRVPPRVTACVLYLIFQNLILHDILRYVSHFVILYTTFLNVLLSLFLLSTSHLDGLTSTTNFIIHFSMVHLSIAIWNHSLFQLQLVLFQNIIFLCILQFHFPESSSFRKILSLFLPSIRIQIHFLLLFFFCD